MRFVWAVAAFVLATLLIGAGIAQRTVFMGPSEQKMELSVDDAAPYILVDADVLRAHDGLQTLRVQGTGDVFVAYGRTEDVTAWLSDTAYDHVTLETAEDGTKSSTTEHVDAAQPAEDGAETSGRNPSGSDLWLESFTDTDSLVTKLQLTEGNSVLIARDGIEPAPTDVAVTWALDTRTPLAGPLMVAGGIMLAVGLVLYALAIRHQRRGRGPRRKGPGPLPETQPISVAGAPKSVDAAPSRKTDKDKTDADQTDADKTDAGVTERRALRRRLTIAAPALLLTAALATGCSADSWPELQGPSATPSPTPTVVAPENQKPPAVAEGQAARIVADITDVITQADTDLDIDLAATRFEGAALEARRTDYALRKAIPERATPTTVPRETVRVLLPEATDTWPRSALVLTATEGDDTVAPVMFTMTQTDPWSNYRVTDIAEMPASGEFPDVAPEWLGATRVPAESPFLALPPAELAAAFSDLVDAGDKSEFSGQFDEVTQTLVSSILESRAAVVQGLADKGASETTKAAFDMAPTDAEPLSIATLGSGAIVAISVTDTESITPTSSDAVIRFGDNAEAKALTGVSEAAKGVQTTYGLQLFFAVPAQGSSEQIRLLAVHQDLLSVKVIE